MSEETAQPEAAGQVDELDPDVTVEDAAEPVLGEEAAEDSGPASPDSAEDVEDVEEDSEEDDGSEDEGDAEEDDDSEDDGDEEVDPLDEEGDIAADYLEELLDIADLDGDIDTYVEGGRAHVSIVTESHTLVGRDGKVLEALQELARLAVMTETGHRSRLMLDVAGYRDVRRKELLILATEAIASVKETGEPEHLAPMTPFERKIIHDAVAAAGLSSESEGTEPKRHVVISA